VICSCSCSCFCFCFCFCFPYRIFSIFAAIYNLKSAFPCGSVCRHLASCSSFKFIVLPPCTRYTTRYRIQPLNELLAYETSKSAACKTSYSLLSNKDIDNHNLLYVGSRYQEGSQDFRSVFMDCTTHLRTSVQNNRQI
jgi:hypothetical protein